ncbi:hypothetical protein LNP18_02790 [Leuconostoc citreum]|uniref:hypothetical protein n=1 Tax=Leuconostoc citreum TaxID=33964 RepID=UPI00200B32E5|nr:hypothetical protein [Leuconostoc citreum]MCK8605024.1 hypothetical protein [Leuconostoc citreum]
MKLPHLFKQAKENRQKMLKQAEKQWQNFDANQHKSPVKNQVIYYMIGGFVFVAILKLLSHWIGG